MTLPAIRLSKDELTSKTLDSVTRLLARQVFASRGVLAIENAFAPDFIASLQTVFMTDCARHLVDRETDDTLKVGEKRFMMRVGLRGAFDSPELHANPFVCTIAQDTLGPECILGSFGAVVALPGAADQHIHRDHPFLFNEQVIDTLMPAYAVNVIVPLVDIDDIEGVTRVWPGSHRVWLEDEARKLPSADPPTQIGSCILMDYRLLHGGTANRSPWVRPVLYLVYQRPWFRDYVNFIKMREPGASAEKLKYFAQIV